MCQPIFLSIFRYQVHPIDSSWPQSFAISSSFLRVKGPIYFRKELAVGLHGFYKFIIIYVYWHGVMHYRALFHALR